MAALLLTVQPILDDLTERLRLALEVLSRRDQRPRLVVLEAAPTPVRDRQMEECLQAGIAVDRILLEPGAPGGVERVRELNQDPKVHGVAIDPALGDELRVRLNPDKDVEGLHPYHLGLLASGRAGFLPPGPAGCLEVLNHYRIRTRGRRVVIVGRGPSLGRPLAVLLQACDATVTVCHRHTRDLANHTRQAEILVTCAGQRDLVTASMIAEGATVLDLACQREGEHWHGDLDTPGLRMVASALCPAPECALKLHPWLLAWNVTEACRLLAAARAQNPRGQSG